MLGKIVINDEDVVWDDPNQRNLVAEVSLEKPTFYPGAGRKKVILVDFGCKDSILRALIDQSLDVLRVPWIRSCPATCVQDVVWRRVLNTGWAGAGGPTRSRCRRSP